MTLIAAALAGLAVAVLASSDPGRLARLGDAPRRPPPLSARGGQAFRHVACVAAGCAAVWVVGSPPGLAVGLVVTFGLARWLSAREPAPARRERLELLAEFPLGLDLLAACLSGGSTPQAAAQAIARSLPGPCGQRFAAVAAAFAVGSPPAQAWLALSAGHQDDPLLPPARLLARAAESGAPVSGAVVRLAAEARAVALSSAQVGIRRVGVLVVAPLGLCFLPAFVLIGVVPVVVGLVAPLLARW